MKFEEKKFVRVEYTVIKDKYYLDIEEGEDEEGEMWVCYLKRGRYGTKRFCCAMPKVIRWGNYIGKPMSIEDAIQSAESLLFESVKTYVEEEEAINDYYNSLDEE